MTNSHDDNGLTPAELEAELAGDIALWRRLVLASAAEDNGSADPFGGGGKETDQVKADVRALLDEIDGLGITRRVLAAAALDFVERADRAAKSKSVGRDRLVAELRAKAAEAVDAATAARSRALGQR